MSKFTVMTNTGGKAQVEKADLLADILKGLGVNMDFPCGGLGKCGQCRVEVSSLTADGDQFNEVLACNYKVNEDLYVKIPGALEEAGIVILTSGTGTSTLVDSGINKTFIPLELTLQGKQSYWQALEAGVRETEMEIKPSLKSLEAFAKLDFRKGQGLTLVSADNRLICLEAGDTTSHNYGLAVDIGTTTVVGYLVDLFTGEEKAVAARLNEQRVYGADVISRITAAGENEKNLKDLKVKVISTVNEIITMVTTQAGIDENQIYSVTMAGNTCMHHLLLGLNPKNLGRAPFLPVYQKALELSGADLGLKVNPQARIWVFPVIAGFVGGDTVAAMLASSLHQEQSSKLLVDIGTNGELVMVTDGRIVACSAAAGPALEGAQISFGMRAEAGAISRVELAPTIRIEVIGGKQAKGICGSGLVDLIGEMVSSKILTQRGQITPSEKYEGPDYLRQRIVKGDKGYSFVLVRAEENDGKEILLTQDDVSQLQLAKGALRGAMELLVTQAGISGEDVEEVLLAGAFGSFIDIEKAHLIGLLPDWARGRVRSIGNAAGEGAKIALISRKKREEAGLLSQKVDFLELAGKQDFEHEFIKGMLFPKL